MTKVISIKTEIFAVGERVLFTVQFNNPRNLVVNNKYSGVIVAVHRLGGPEPLYCVELDQRWEIGVQPVYLGKKIVVRNVYDYCLTRS